MIDTVSVRAADLAGSVFLSIYVMVALNVAVGSAVADSSFRGFAISDSFEQVSAKAKNDGFTVKVLDPMVATDDKQKHVYLRLKNETCASLTFGVAKTITQMDLYPCFYNGQNLTLQQVVSEFVDRFGGEPKLDVYPKENCKNAHPWVYTGKTREGEFYEIFQDCVVAIRIRPGSKVQF